MLDLGGACSGRASASGRLGWGHDTTAQLWRGPYHATHSPSIVVFKIVRPTSTSGASPGLFRTCPSSFSLSHTADIYLL